MKAVTILSLLFYIILPVTACFAQRGGPGMQPAGDTSISFKVSGVCEQCRHRIEEAAKGRGVSFAGWNVNTGVLSLQYNPSKTTIEKIKNRILAAGHDLENKKASDAVYRQLPECCHYREMESISEGLQEDSSGGRQNDMHAMSMPSSSAQPAHTIQGVVLESDRKGQFRPLQGASVYWLGSGKGTITDSNGIFKISQSLPANRLVVSFAGYQPDTLSITDRRELKIILGSDKQLQEVRVTASQRSSYVLSVTPIRTQVMTDKELFKAACCNLSESFETNPSVDVSYNDAVTGSKQIQLLGLSGNYTQLTVENLPGPRGLATPLGLNSIAGPWVESIQLTKGIGSVANGFESIAGQINIELKKPENSERLFANAYVNDFGKTDINLNLSHKIGKKWATGFLLHDDFLYKTNLDFNKDGFRDLPSGNQFSGINRWKYDNAKGLLAQFGVKVLNDNRTGGETAFNPAVDKFTSNHYGLGINTRRYEAFGKIGFVFPGKKYKSVGLQLSAISHKQDSYFGMTSYNAAQQSFYTNLIYQSIIGNTNHMFRTGISFLYDNYNEDFKIDNYKRTETVPGAFFEYTYSIMDNFTAVLGLRADHNSMYGFFITPRLHVRYQPVEGTTIRVSAGRGQRTANIFAENMSALVSARQVKIRNGQAGKAYGLEPEVAWNKGISIDQQLKLFGRNAVFGIDYFRNDFSSQVVADLENPREVAFYNLEGRSYSNSLQAELTAEPLKKLELRFAYRYFDVKTVYDGRLLQRPLTAAHRFFSNMAYAMQGWKFDFTLNYNGKKRIPGTAGNPGPYRRSEYSPAYVLMNAQVTKSFGKKYPMDVYAGAENIGNYFQKDIIIAADQPFSPYFDASLVWGPVSGRMFYAGWRIKIK